MVFEEKKNPPNEQSRGKQLVKSQYPDNIHYYRYCCAIGFLGVLQVPKFLFGSLSVTDTLLLNEKEGKE